VDSDKENTNKKRGGKTNVDSNNLEFNRCRVGPLDINKVIGYSRWFLIDNNYSRKIKTAGISSVTRANGRKSVRHPPYGKADVGRMLSGPTKYMSAPSPRSYRLKVSEKENKTKGVIKMTRGDLMNKNLSFMYWLKKRIGKEKAFMVCSMTEKILLIFGRERIQGH
jgi:hypothetical protein